MATVVLKEINTAAVVLTPAVKPPQIEIRRAEVVVHHIQNHREAILMGLLDEFLKRLRPTIGRFHCEDVRGVVALSLIHI